VLPVFERTPSNSFLQQLDASGRKWVIFVDDSGAPRMDLDAHHFLRDVLFNEVSVGPEPYWHRPIVITGMSARLRDVIGLNKMKPEHTEDDVIDQDLILVWGKQKRIITGTDLLGRPAWNHHTGSQTELKGDDAEQCGRCAFHAHFVFWEPAPVALVAKGTAQAHRFSRHPAGMASSGNAPMRSG
jgi:hypothetical protein